MKKILSSVLALTLLVATMAGCSSNDNPSGSASPSATAAASPSATASSAAPTAEEVKGVTIPEFKVSVNGTEVTQESMASYPVYSVQATSVNSAGTESTTTYVGFAMKDVLTAAKLTEQYVWMEAAASDGYSATFDAEMIYAPTTLLAISKDGSPFSGSPWFAPCTDQTTGNYIKDTASILVNTTEGKPDTAATPSASGAADPSAAAGAKPEILDRTDKVEFKAFSFKVNGKAVNNDALKDAKIYKISVATKNANGESVTSDYTGYKLADVLTAAGAKDYKAVKAVADDGYATELTAEQAKSDYTLVAIEKDKETGKDGTIWVAPCEETESKKFAKLVVDIVTE